MQSSPIDWEFGRIHIGEISQVPPRSISGYRFCLNKRDRMSCELKLSDGIWYRFYDGRLRSKAISVRDRRRPWWIDPNDSPRECKARLERLTRFRFKIARSEDGSPMVRTSNLVSTRNGYWYDIIVIFEHGKMSEVYMDSIGDPDA